MINFSTISKDFILGKILRGFLKIIPKNSVLPILQGRLKGKKWIIGSGVFGYWLGTYELEKQKLFQKAVKRGDVVFDIGAHVGFFTLLAAELVGEKGKVFALEPLTRNLYFLKKHIALNLCNNVEIIEMAVSDRGGWVNFNEGENGFTGGLDKKGRLKVISVALDDLLKEGKILPPNVLKIDVEGAELMVLKGAKDILSKYRPGIFLSIHNKKIFDDCFNFLKKLGYNLELIVDEDIRKSGEILCLPKMKNEER